MIRSAIRRIHDRWADLNLFIRLVSLILMVALLGLFGVKPCYKAFKQWRMESNLAAAQQAITDVRMDDARDLSRTVLQAGDPRIEALRILEQSMLALHDPMHGDIARAMITHPDSTDDDRLKGFRGIVQDTPLGVVGQMWVALPSRCQKESRFALAFADRLITEHHFKEAASLLLAVPTQEQNGALKRGLIRVLIGSGKREGFEEALRLIAVGLQADDQEAIEWLKLLGEIPLEHLRNTSLDSIRGRIENLALGDSADTALILVRMDYASQVSRRETLLAETIAKWQDSNPQALARFLKNLGLYQLLLETFPEAKVSAHPELFPQVLDAAERAGAWDQVQQLLDDHGQQLPKLEELAHRSVLAAKTDESADRASAWHAAIAEAQSSAEDNAYLTLLRITRDAGMQDESEQALIAAIRKGRGPLPVFADLKPLLQSLERQGHEQVLLDICKAYLSFESGNPVLLTQYAYLACLNQLAEPSTFLKTLEPLAKAYPKELPIHCVLATVYLCDGQPDKAAAMLDGFKLDPDKLAPGYQAAFLTTQVLNNRIAKDDPQIETFPWKSLLPCERRKFSELLRNAPSP